MGIASVTDIAFHGPTLYGLTFTLFLRLNPDTGAGTVVGPTGFSANGLAVASDGRIYAGAGGQLITINPVTGAGTLVGNFGGGLVSSGDLAFDSNDVLYGALMSGTNGILARIDRTTGVATSIGSTGVSDMYGLAFCCCRLLGASSGGALLDINAATGQATLVGKNSLTQWGLAVRPCCCC
ncbi:MAG: hypothetical protein ACKV2U_01075 [Bryobacteraceae bacterium]